MFGIFGFLIKGYVAVLLLRSVMTRQELYFNPIGKMIATVTEPIFTNALKMTKKKSDQLTFPFIIILTILQGLIYYGFAGTPQNGVPLFNAIWLSTINMIQFLLIFYAVSVIIGSIAVNRGMGQATTFFYRLGLFWVKLARTFVKIPGNGIIIPAVLIQIIVFTLIGFVVTVLYFTIASGDPLMILSFKVALKNSLSSFIMLVTALTWILIIRALISWVNPDPHNPVVQLLGAITDPIVEPFRKIIPPIGMIDISFIVVILVLNVIKAIIIRLVGMI